MTKQVLSPPRYSPAEILGRDVSSLAVSERAALLSAQGAAGVCPFTKSKCIKKGSVCSLRKYSKVGNDTGVPVQSTVVATCPNRFRESAFVTNWVGQELLGTPKALEVWELGFLLSDDREATGTLSKEDTVGRIDRVLVHPNTATLKWCALETQAVYFSGPALGPEINRIATREAPGLPFPSKIRRPDFRSSGPKRLMPQLQIKVPTLRRWGIKMAVVVDLPFWKSLGEMAVVGDVSNADIAWFVVKWEAKNRGLCIAKDSLRFTTLDAAVEGLTGGTPVTKSQFENTIREKLSD